MRAKLIYEKFREDSDPIKDMNVGIKDYDDYIRKKLKEKGDDIKEFYDWYYEVLMEMSTQKDLIKMIEEILKHTPLYYQIDWANDMLSRWEVIKQDR